jgi:hypothetical protein
LERAKLYRNDLPLQPVQNTVQDSSNSTIFKQLHLQWTQISNRETLPSFSFPLEITTVTNFLTSYHEKDEFHDQFDSEDDEVLIDYGTKKPASKGRRLYFSEKLHFIEWASTPGGHFLFRGNMEASMKRKIIRMVAAEVKSDSK